MELTESEKKVLNGISFHTEEIESGELCEDDVALLSEMRAVQAYLSSKYSDFNFEIVGCEPKSGTAREYSEWYFKAAEIERDSAFIAMSEEKDGRFEIRDAFFGQLIKEPIREKLESILSSAGFPVISIEVSFWDYLGKDVDEHIVAEDVLTGKIQAGNDFKIFLDDSKLDNKDYNALSGKLRECLLAENICGEIYLVVVEHADGDFAKDRLFSDSVMLE